MYFVRDYVLHQISINSYWSLPRPIFTACSMQGVPVGLRSGINEVVMVYMGHTVKLAAADNGLFIYRICTGYVQCYRIERGQNIPTSGTMGISFSEWQSQLGKHPLQG